MRHHGDTPIGKAAGRGTIGRIRTTDAAPQRTFILGGVLVTDTRPIVTWTADTKPASPVRKMAPVAKPGTITTMDEMIARSIREIRSTTAQLSAMNRRNADFWANPK